MRAIGAVGAHAFRMGAQQVVGDGRRVSQIVQAGRMRAVDVAFVHDDPGFVEGAPVLNLTIQCAGHDCGKVSKAVRGVAVEPAAVVVQCGG